MAYVTPASVNVITKTSPHTSLSLTNHVSPPPINTSATSATLGSADSAQSLLRDMHNESEGDRSGSKRGVFQWRSSRGSVSREGRSNRYVKMGILMDSPTKVITPTLQWPSESVDKSGDGVVCEGMDGEYEVLRLEGDLQASPPISVKSEALHESGGEGPTSSPDSGYGNTPDNPGPGAREGEHLAGVRTASMGLGPARQRSGAINGSKRSREDTQDSACACSMATSPRSEPALSSTTSTASYGSRNRLSSSPMSHNVMMEEGPPSHGATVVHSIGMDTCLSQDSGQDSGGLVSASLSSAGVMDRQLQQRTLNHLHPSSRCSTLPSPSRPPGLSPSALTQSSGTTCVQSKRLRGRTSSSKHWSKSTGLFGQCVYYAIRMLL